MIPHTNSRQIAEQGARIVSDFEKKLQNVNNEYEEIKNMALADKSKEEIDYQNKVASMLRTISDYMISKKSEKIKGVERNLESIIEFGKEKEKKNLEDSTSIDKDCEVKKDSLYDSMFAEINGIVSKRLKDYEELKAGNGIIDIEKIKRAQTELNFINGKQIRKIRKKNPWSNETYTKREKELKEIVSKASSKKLEHEDISRHPVPLPVRIKEKKYNAETKIEISVPILKDYPNAKDIRNVFFDSIEKANPEYKEKESSFVCYEFSLNGKNPEAKNPEAMSKLKFDIKKRIESLDSRFKPCIYHDYFEDSDPETAASKIETAVKAEIPALPPPSKPSQPATASEPAAKTSATAASNEYKVGLKQIAEMTGKPYSTLCLKIFKEDDPSFRNKYKKVGKGFLFTEDSIELVRNMKYTPKLRIKKNADGKKGKKGIENEICHNYGSGKLDKVSKTLEYILNEGEIPPLEWIIKNKIKKSYVGYKSFLKNILTHDKDGEKARLTLEYCYAERGLSTGRIAKKIGVSQATVSNDLSKRGVITREAIKRKYDTLEKIKNAEFSGIDNYPKENVRWEMLKNIIDYLPKPDKFSYLGLEGPNFASYIYFSGLCSIDPKKSLIAENRSTAYNMMQSIIRNNGEIDDGKILKDLNLYGGELLNVIKSPKYKDFKFDVINLDFSGYLKDDKIDVINGIFENNKISDKGVVFVTLNNHPRFKKSVILSDYGSEDQNTPLNEIMNKNAQKYGFNVEQVIKQEYKSRQTPMLLIGYKLEKK